MRDNPKLDDACSITTGKLDSNQVVVGGQYPFFTCASEPLTIDSYAFDGSVVLVAGNNASGTFHVNRYDGKFNAYQRTYVLTAKPGFDLDYVFYSLKLELKRLKEKSQGSQTKFLTLPILKDIDVTRRELPLQKKIASVLVSLDFKIEVNKRINAELEAMAKTLYDYWFVQFDFPGQHGKPYKSSGGKMAWNDELKRETPDGWESGTILNAGHLLGGGTPRKDEPSYWNGSIPFFTPTDSEESIFVMDTEDHITEAGLKNCSSKLYPKGTIFITARGTVGTINIASRSMAMNQSCYAIQAKPDVNYYYLHQCCRDLIQFMRVKAGGSVFDSLVTNDFKLTPIVVPDSKIIELFGKTCGAWYETILTNKKQNQELADLRDWLLPMLMNGQVKVGD